MEPMRQGLSIIAKRGRNIVAELRERGPPARVGCSPIARCASSRISPTRVPWPYHQISRPVRQDVVAAPCCARRRCEVDMSLDSYVRARALQRGHELVARDRCHVGDEARCPSPAPRCAWVGLHVSFGRQSTFGLTRTAASQAGRSWVAANPLAYSDSRRALLFGGQSGPRARYVVSRQRELGHGGGPCHEVR